jgi:hypothetical protein
VQGRRCATENRARKEAIHPDQVDALARFDAGAGLEIKASSNELLFKGALGF